ncbi:MAG: ABC transporter permease [Bacteroidaceae bacterium]|nr:ABC transporter permease [Bacteroidaceae bacterium]
MIKQYFKQAWTMMKQNKLFTSIYVAGTGLSIALVMTLFIIFYVKFASVYPEYNRNRTLVVSTTKRINKANEGNWSTNSGTSWKFTNGLLGNLKNAVAVAGVAEGWNIKQEISRIGSEEVVEVKPKYVNGGFWQVFTFDFTDGHPFTTEEVEAVQPVVVISKSLAEQMFANPSSTGEKLFLNGKEFTVCGVVKDVSNATPASAADIWIPITHNAQAIADNPNLDLMGGIVNYLLAPTVGDKDALRAEVQDIINKYNQQDETYRHEFFGQPDDYWKSTFRGGMAEEFFETWDLLKEYIYILLAFLIIPALNLSGMISNRMDSRMSELGVRKAYGATNRQIITQVLWENLLITLMGGIVGLLLSYGIVLTAKQWILTLFDRFIMNPNQSMDISFEMLFNPVVFGSALLFCILLNLISALIPTGWALRRSIIQSIHTKR